MASRQGRNLILVHNEKKTDISSCSPLGIVSAEAKKIARVRKSRENYMKKVKKYFSVYFRLQMLVWRLLVPQRLMNMWKCQ